MNQQDLVKLTIPQLRAICKEKKIVGYGKIPKSGVIQKILDHDAANLTRPLPTDNLVLAAADSPATACNVKVVTVIAHNPKPSAVQTLCGPGVPGLPSNFGSTNVQAPATASGQRPPPTWSQSASKGLKTTPPKTLSNVTPPVVPVSITTNSSVSQLKRKIYPSPEMSLSNKKQKEDVSARVRPLAQVQFGVPTVTKPLAGDIINQTQITVVNTHGRVNAGLRQPSAMDNTTNDARPSLQAGIFQKKADVDLKAVDTISKKRFVPLMVKRNLATPSQSQLGRAVATQTSTRECALVGPLLHHLDFPIADVPKLHPVTPSPSLAQRKRVPTLALILSGISESELRVCAQVSRLFRYAAYISASDRLSREFPGQRLESVLRAYSVKMINMWPYLTYRKVEREARKGGYEASFLGRALSSRLIVNRLWASPDHEMQITVAIRFLLTRLFFVISIGHDHKSLHESTIVDAQEVIPDEIWHIIVRSPRGIEKFYVLLATCEVVGRSSPARSPQPTEAPALRADWTAYIHARLFPHVESSASTSRDQPPTSLIERLKWTNHEEYERGISRLWLARIVKEGEVGVVKRTVAQRYVMACVVGNSVSGRWMSSSDMALEFNGNGAPLPSILAPSKQKCPKVHLFLPAHHHVESVHFTTSAGQLLHPALAIIQTPGREYYILRDNGMQVGCEEEGVAEVWMSILGCTNGGVDMSCY